MRRGRSEVLGSVSAVDACCCQSQRRERHIVATDRAQGTRFAIVKSREGRRVDEDGRLLTAREEKSLDEMAEIGRHSLALP